MQSLMIEIILGSMRRPITMSLMLFTVIMKIIILQVVENLEIAVLIRNLVSLEQIWKLKMKIMNLSTNIEDNNVILSIETL
jgi:hypothetical protein